MRAPTDLYGRPHADRLLRALVPVVAGYQRLSKLSARRQPEVAPVDRDLVLEVRGVDRVAEDVVALRLADPQGRPLPRWRSGGHLDVILASGRRRQYSLCGDPLDRMSYRIAVRLVSEAGGSGEMHTVTAGGTLTVRGPRNAFPFVDRGPYLFVAGGIGITPILPMVRMAARRGTDWRLVYTGRSHESMPFLDELAALPTTDRVRVLASESVPEVADLLADAPSGASLYCCGPSPMIDAVRREWTGPLHFERFSPPPVVDGKPFELQLGVDGPVLPVAPDESALEALRRARPGAAYSCRQGFCGTCRVGVLAGAVDHQGAAVPDGSMLVCVSRAADERIVLDV
ncbi:Vanillate O-demethylase oxidoreductase [Alloactinosynnema sp. L-07]|uniref:PDR/VanB family oxidoreductase n=1 Tax=Alloactinosynnema sp. L-07 TaxID=1653480 RepID=UPI00065F0A12|nr:PDR/VanB family oxidoreductase [Alloactinosynnema sp. L-07]CRK61552.1 Vanillate O-demethylase oxidoreductase [Alloactinosynnema sp. L-07]